MSDEIQYYIPEDVGLYVKFCLSTGRKFLHREDTDELIAIYSSTAEFDAVMRAIGRGSHVEAKDLKKEKFDMQAWLLAQKAKPKEKEHSVLEYPLEDGDL